MSKLSYEQKIAALKKEYIVSLPNLLKDISSAWEHLQFVNWNSKKLEKLKFDCHTMIGSSGNLGFLDISTAAKLLDQQLRTADTPANVTQRGQINTHLMLLKEAIATTLNSFSKDTGIPLAPNLTDPIKTKSASIAIIEDEHQQAELLKLNLEELGYSVELFSSPNNFSKDQKRMQFDLIILDISFPDGPLEGLFWLEKIHKQLQTHSPIIITSARSDFVIRMRAMRAGASAYIAKPIDMSEVDKQISHCLQEQRKAGTRVLCVDDDAQLLKLYNLACDHEGFVYKGITQPLKIIESLESFKPDIIIMDYEMPECNGGELVSMLKQDIRFMSIPVIFASGSDKAEEQKEYLNILGSAFLKKPFDTKDLIYQIKTQLSKAKLISRKIEQVSQRTNKNGLQTKRFFLDKLENFLYQNHPQKGNAFLVYASIDNIDYLKERFGLRNLETLNTQLERYLAEHSLIQGNGCLIGNASFLVLTHINESEDENATLHNLQQAINKKTWHVDDKSCQLSLSMGATKLHKNNKLDDVIANIEQACFEGMTSGSNKLEWVKTAEQKQEVLDSKIKSLLKEQAFKLYYQPIVNIETDDTVFEALIRLEDSDGHIFPPNQFIPWVKTDQDRGSNSLDSWLIEHAVAEINQISTAQNQQTSIVVKLASSLSQIVGLLPEIRFAIQQNKTAEHGKLIFALPISDVIKEVAKAKQVIESLEELGCGFMLEQVEASEVHIKLLNDIGQLDYVKLKITASNRKNLSKFISSIPQPGDKAPIIVASGIEDSVMLAQYWELGIRHFQGYFIQRPGEDTLYNKANNTE